MDKNEIDKKIEELYDRISPIGMTKYEQKEILSELDSILEQDPNHTEVLELKGMVYQFCDDYDKAIETLKQILEIDPNNKLAKDNIETCKSLMDISKDRIEYSNNSTPQSEYYHLMEKVSIWYILLGKIIILSIVIYFCFMQ